LLSTVSEHDLVVVSVARAASGDRHTRARTARAFRKMSAPLLLVDEMSRRSGSIGVVAPADADPDEIASVVAALAPHYGRSTLFIWAGCDAQDRDPWQRDMRERLAAHRISGRFRAIADAAQAGLDRIVADEAPRIVVVLAPEAEAREAMLESFACPLLVLPNRRPERC
jgi:hypothetical protein